LTLRFDPGPRDGPPGLGLQGEEFPLPFLTTGSRNENEIFLLSMKKFRSMKIIPPLKKRNYSILSEIFPHRSKNSNMDEP
jgi:hypothetical protein